MVEKNYLNVIIDVEFGFGMGYIISKFSFLLVMQKGEILRKPITRYCRPLQNLIIILLTLIQGETHHIVTKFNDYYHRNL